MISNMVKALAKEDPEQEGDFYLEAFKKIDRLSKLQLIICPDSQFHAEESLFSKYPKEHKRVYELLSHGVSYWDQWTILRFEIMEHLKNWMAGKPTKETSFVTQQFVHGKVNVWQPRLLISVNSSWLENNKANIKVAKDTAFDHMRNVYKRWESEKGKNFDYWYSEELSGWRVTITGAYSDYLKKAAAVFSGIDPNCLNILPTPLAQIFQEVLKEISKSFPDENERDIKLAEFLSATSLENVPFIRIYCSILATIAHRLSVGNMKAEKIKSSFFTDVFISATILPFCDVIFLEKQIAGFMKEKPLNVVLGKMPKIYSLSSKDEFLAHLDEIEAQASEEHIRAVKEIYGEDWGKPFCKVLREEFN